MTKVDFLNKCKRLGVLSLPNIHHDFLAVSTNENDNIKETAKYFYKPFKAAGSKEIRFWKKSKRVSTSATETKNK